jgi:hypothetical protein
LPRLGADVATQVVLLRGRTAGEILGRREREEGGAWRLIPSPLLSAPVVVFDEFDKASSEPQQAALAFQGNTRAIVEGTAVEALAIPMLTCNKRHKLPTGRRVSAARGRARCRAAGGMLGDIDRAMRAMHEAGGPPRLDLSRYAPPPARVSGDSRGGSPAR